MPAPAEEMTRPVRDDDVSKGDEIAVGEDMEFQSRWWRFERFVWAFFTLVLIADLAGALGRGPLANAKGTAPDGSLTVKYERVERANSSSIVTVLPPPSAVHNGAVQLFVSETVLDRLGAQRVIPQPKDSVLGPGGVTYTFPASAQPTPIQIELKPSFIGLHHFTIGVPGSQPVQASAFVLP